MSIHKCSEKSPIIGHAIVISVLTEMNTPQSIQRRRNQLHKTDITFRTLIITLTHQIQNDKTHNDTSHYVHTHSNMRTKNMADCTFTYDPNVCAYFQKSKPPVKNQSGSLYTPVWFTVHTSLVHRQQTH